jgi:hypothetical protein
VSDRGWQRCSVHLAHLDRYALAQQCCPWQCLHLESMSLTTVD